AAGQKLWLWPKGSADGPQRFELDRFSVLPSLYEISPQSTAGKINSFFLHFNFSFHYQLASSPRSIVDDLICAMVIDPKKLLSQAWRATSVNGLTEKEWQRLAAMPISEAEALELAKTKWKDPAFRNQTLNEWNEFARTKYQRFIKPPLIRSEWL